MLRRETCIDVQLAHSMTVASAAEPRQRLPLMSNIFKVTYLKHVLLKLTQNINQLAGCGTFQCKKCSMAQAQSTLWGRVMHDNWIKPSQHLFWYRLVTYSGQATIWTKAGLLLIRSLGFSGFWLKKRSTVFFLVRKSNWKYCLCVSASLFQTYRTMSLWTERRVHTHRVRGRFVNVSSPNSRYRKSNTHCMVWKHFHDHVWESQKVLHVHMLGSLNHVHVQQVSPPLGCGSTC